MEAMHKVWVCEFAACGHVWLAGAEPPARCAKCKRANWHKRKPLQYKPRSVGTVDLGVGVGDTCSLPERKTIPLTVASALPQPLPKPDKIANLGKPRTPPGQKCPHGWANSLQCKDGCND